MAASKQLVDVDPKNSNDAKWSKLAKKQGMNTDVRKAIFVALMGAEVFSLFSFQDMAHSGAHLGLR